ncbi:MAG: 2-dehydropantoate 2-reductase [Desulfobacterales bacterium]|jgi:2-dehydropantoate 2-reductase|nr:2-dehydropantoate 2-reductase [Desulfobacteraceae bacterium]MDD3990828.1 2-dehydropantoate 2-reductase [Desulfobacteraceae bacterium]MDY0311229.1 2-dehydropantoate 2-reductase [Desulfobacterales bacterium]
MRIAVFGTGAVGGYFGGRLAQAGHDVTFIARGAHLEAIRRNGLQVESIAGDFHVSPAKATDDPSAVGAVDLVLVGVKAPQVPEAARAIPPMVGAETVVLPLQNGVEAADQLVDVLGRGPVVGGLCKLIAMTGAPGRIYHLGMPPQIVFGELDNRSSGRISRLKSLFDQCQGVEAHLAEDIHAALWGKFLFIAAFSGVGAVTRVTAGVMRSIPETRQLIEAAMVEVRELALARGVRMADDVVVRAMAAIDALPPEGTASMQRDIMSGRPSELSAQNGAVVRLASEVGVTVPVNDFLYRTLVAQEKLARGEIDPLAPEA